MKLKDYAKFAAAITPDLVRLGRALFDQFDGDIGASRAALRTIPDHWQGVEEGRARRDRELAELKAQGK